MTAAKIPYLELFPAAGTAIMDDATERRAVDWLLERLFGLAHQLPSEALTLLTSLAEAFADRTDSPAEALDLIVETLALARRELLGVPEEVTSG